MVLKALRRGKTSAVKFLRIGTSCLAKNRFGTKRQEAKNGIKQWQVRANIHPIVPDSLLCSALQTL